jgi:hypothetical protein
MDTLAGEISVFIQRVYFTNTRIGASIYEVSSILQNKYSSCPFLPFNILQSWLFQIGLKALKSTKTALIWQPNKKWNQDWNFSISCQM